MHDSGDGGPGSVCRPGGSQSRAGLLGAWSGYLADLTAAGLLVDAGGLQPPSSATTVRVRDGRRVLQDGPFADTKEQLGGYFLIEVENLDIALD
ncbi:YciI family protein [Nakamurella sp. UYEF19]|uniref:YciI family protein n=1 Tax=Nakamurella sp. UYEF19 TaxID=1756392 RepID=UPI00339086B7